MNKESKNQSDTKVHLSDKSSVGEITPTTILCICENEFGDNEDCPHCYPIYMINIKP